MIKVSAPGSVFFFGEHSVVYERPAIVTAVDMRTCTTIEKRDDDRIIVNSKDYGVIDAKISELLEKPFTDHTAYKDLMDPLKDLIATFYRKNNISSGLEMQITSDMPRGAGGLSTSTSALCSVLAALNLQFGNKIKPEEFFDWLYPFQVKIHGGKASGSEITSSSLGGYNLVRIDKSGEKPRLEKKNLGVHEFYIVIGDTKVERQTKETVPYVASGWEKDKESYEQVFDKIKEIVLAGERAILNGDLKLVGELINQNHEILARDLGVSHPKLNKLINAARKAGAYGAKLSGAGKGGIMIALTDKDNQMKVAKAIESAGGRSFITKVGVEGIKIER